MNKYEELKIKASQIEYNYLSIKNTEHYRDIKKWFINESGEMLSRYNNSYTIETSQTELKECYYSHNELHEMEDNYIYLDLSNDYNFDKVFKFETQFILRNYVTEIHNNDLKEKIINDFISKCDTVLILRENYCNTDLVKLENNNRIKYNYKDVDIICHYFNGNTIQAKSNTYYYKFETHKELTKFLKTFKLNVLTITTLNKQMTDINKQMIDIDMNNPKKVTNNHYNFFTNFLNFSNIKIFQHIKINFKNFLKELKSFKFK